MVFVPVGSPEPHGIESARNIEGRFPTDEEGYSFMDCLIDHLLIWNLAADKDNRPNPLANSHGDDIHMRQDRYQHNSLWRIGKHVA